MINSGDNSRPKLKTSNPFGVDIFINRLYLLHLGFMIYSPYVYFKINRISTQSHCANWRAKITPQMITFKVKLCGQLRMEG